MRFATACSGIEACSVAWHPLGWKSAFYSEIKAFPSHVLNYHYPDTPNLGDMTKIFDTYVFAKESDQQTIDLFCAGTPCQSFSIAGLRNGLADPRGNLALVFLKIISALQPRWLVWENVPGVLSSNKGRDFGTFLAALGKCGYGWAYRVLDARHFGTAQQRRRVFVVGHFGGWQRAAAVLFDREAVRLSAKSGRRKAKEYSRRIGSIGPGPARSFRVDSKSGNSMRSSNPNSGIRPVEYASTLLASGPGYGHQGMNIVINEDGTPRHLTPLEWERLQGFPDGYTDVPGWKTNRVSVPGTINGTPDSPRYEALGNSMPVPVMRWIGERIQLVDQILV